jgi:hypothetical protein
MKYGSDWPPDFWTAWILFALPFLIAIGYSVLRLRHISDKDPNETRTGFLRIRRVFYWFMLFIASLGLLSELVLLLYFA